jgi:hypothetical protein
VSVEPTRQHHSDVALWLSDLGARYLDQQRLALQRGVQVRRVFVTDDARALDDPAFRRILATQVGIGILVRASIAMTRRVLDAEQVADRATRLDRIWEAGAEPSPAEVVERPR